MMAIDTRNKRSSAISITQPWRVMLPLPDGTIAAGDRLHIAWLYAGIAAASAVFGPWRVAELSVTQGGVEDMMAVQGQFEVAPSVPEVDGLFAAEV